MAETDQIQLALPAEHEYGRVARIAAAHIALRGGYSLAEIDDLRLAIDEAAIMLLGQATNGGSHLLLTYDTSGEDFVIEARIDADEVTALTAPEVDRFERIAASLVDDFDIDTVTRRVRLRKARATPEG